jgi:hypothetical protein
MNTNHNNPKPSTPSEHTAPPRPGFHFYDIVLVVMGGLSLAGFLIHSVSIRLFIDALERLAGK